MPRYAHRTDVPLWLCPCAECTRHEWDANDQPGSLAAFRRQHRAELGAR